eukprot:GGOE01057355.1.p1 GENE.GGOE01057355.1~~GGOE01057355.1.p1  ORF type:complete len:680 (-),score=145.73 GGOE01057355.1:139-2148(-)
MWQFHAEMHNILHLYHFRKAMWEEAYEVKSRQWRWYSCVIHFYGRVIYSSPRVISIQPGDPGHIPPEFWTYVAIMVLGLVCLLLGHFSEFGRRRIVELHFAFCMLMIGTYSYLCPQSVATSSSALSSFWIPSSSYHMVLQGPDGQSIVDEQLKLFLQQVSARVAVGESITSLLPLMLHIALTGLTPYTIPVIFLSIIGLSCSFSFTPNVGTSELVWALTIVSLNAIFFSCIAAVVECWSRSQFLAETLLARELYSSQTADSILNHTLKNILCDAAGTIELFLAGAVERNVLEGSIHCLRRGMRACKERQVYLKLVVGEYTPALHTVDLEEFGQELVTGRAMDSGFEKLTVRTDVTLLNLVLENAISNALKHGDPANPEVRLGISSSPMRDEPFRRVLHFTVTNVAHPQRPPLTPEYVDRLLAGTADVPNNAMLPAMSDRIGISHCVLAAHAGRITLRLAQEANAVRFCASVEAEVIPDQPITRGTSSSGPLTVPFPTGLCFAILDDSHITQMLLQFHISKWCSPSAVHCFGKQEEDIETFVAASLAEADIVILDQNLQYSHLHLGSDIARRLVQSGFSGFICLRSANDSVEDRELYMSSGAHCCFGKDLPCNQLLAELKEQYCLFQRGASIEQVHVSAPSSLFLRNSEPLAGTRMTSTLCSISDENLQW